MNLRSNLCLLKEERKNEKEADEIESLWPYAIVTALNCVSFPIFFASIYCSRSPQWHNFHSPSLLLLILALNIYHQVNLNWVRDEMAAIATIFKRSNYYGANSSFFFFAQAEEILKWINLLCKFCHYSIHPMRSEKKLTAAARKIFVYQKLICLDFAIHVEVYEN